MKKVHELFHKMKDEDYVIHQFTRDIVFNNNEAESRKILFVNVQHNGRNFYRYIQPYIDILEFGLAKVAMNRFIEYRVNREYAETDWSLDDRYIYWATTIVFPFTPKPLNETFARIRQINPDCKIIYYIDFNFYKLPKEHVLSSYFKSNDIKTIEDNIFQADQINFTNINLGKEICDVFLDGKTKNKYSDYNIEEFKDKFHWHPIMISPEIAYENIQNIPEDKKQTDSEKLFKIGIIGTNYHFNDIKNYAKSLLHVQKEIGKDKVKFYLIGFDGYSFDKKSKCFEDEFEYEYVNPCTMVHWHKLLIDLNLDLFFIPLKKTIFNSSGEDLNKFMEFTAVNVPVLAPDMVPYSDLFNYQDMMFVYSDANDLKSKMISIINMEDKTEMEKKVLKANEYLKGYHILTAKNINKLSSIVEGIY